MQFNPGNVVNKHQNNNPTIPNFYYGPTSNEMFGGSNSNSDNKIKYFLKQEIDEYRTMSKHLKFTKKDLMIRMLIDEIDRQHKRIKFLESKVKN
jgi:hypothetical protein